MSQEAETIKSFTDLDAWREAHALAVMIYKATKHFPKEETFALTSQIRRAATSVSANIAEGFSRKTSADREHFYTMSLGSLTELQSHLMISRDVGYMILDDFKLVSTQSIKVHKILTGLIRATKQRSSRS